MAIELIEHKIGNGLNTLLWFDPWWHKSCLATASRDLSILQTGLAPNACVHALISSGRWILPSPVRRFHHTHPTLQNWLDNFDYPEFDLSVNDTISWNDTPLHKTKAWHTWNAVRFKLPEVHWHNLVWHKLHVERYAHHQWLICLGKIATLHRPASFGLDVLPHCLLCVGGVETYDHLFTTCAYSKFILDSIARNLHLLRAKENWMTTLTAWGNVSAPHHRCLGFLAIQVFCYHIWRERNARLHDKGSFGPRKLLEGILLDIRTRIINSSWLQKLDCIRTFCTWLDLTP